MKHFVNNFLTISNGIWYSFGTDIKISFFNLIFRQRTCIYFHQRSYNSKHLFAQQLASRKGRIGFSAGHFARIRILTTCFTIQNFSIFNRHNFFYSKNRFSSRSVPPSFFWKITTIYHGCSLSWLKNIHICLVFNSNRERRFWNLVFFWKNSLK